MCSSNAKCTFPISVKSICLTLLVFNGGSSEFTPNSELTNVLNPFNRTKQLNLIESEIVNTSETHSSLSSRDFSANLLHIILSNFNLIELSNIAAVDGRLASVARHIYQQRYGNYDLSIVYDGIGDDDDAKISIKTNFQRIDIYNYQMSLNVLQYFNIHKLKIYPNLSGIDRSKVINQFTNKYASKHLTHFDFVIVDDTLQHFTLPFEHVEDLQCTINAKRTAVNHLPFNQLFPKLRRLTLNLETAASYHLVDCELVYLESVDIRISFTSWKHEDRILGFLTKNSKIKSITLYNFSPKYVNIINVVLANLENVTLNTVNVGGHKIRFKNVKNVVLHGNYRDYTTKLSFPQLKSIQIFYSPDLLDGWDRFFKKHRKLRKLYVIEDFKAACNDLVRLTVRLYNLIEISLRCNSIANVDEIDRFIQNHSKIMTIRFMVSYYMDSELRVLRERFQNEWKIIEPNSHSEVLQMERRNLTVVN